MEVQRVKSMEGIEGPQSDARRGFHGHCDGFKGLDPCRSRLELLLAKMMPVLVMMCALESVKNAFPWSFFNYFAFFFLAFFFGIFF